MRTIIISIESRDGETVHVCVGDHAELLRADNKGKDTHEKVISEALQRAVEKTCVMCLDALAEQQAKPEPPAKERDEG